MCRSKADGGRRCPCSSPEHRSAVRKAVRAAKVAAAATIGVGHSTPLPLAVQWRPETVTRVQEQLPGLLERGWSRENTLDELARVVEHAPENRGAVAAVAHRREVIDELDAAGLVPREEAAALTGAALAERVTVAVGAAVVAEAQRRAGVDVPALVQACARQDGQVKAQIAEHNERMEHVLAEQKQALRAGDQERANRVIGEFNAQAVAVNAAAAAAQRELAAEHARLAEATRVVLAETREFGGEAVFHEKTTKQAAAAFGEATAWFPSDWIAAHNQGDAVYARISTKRAHYARRSVVATKRRVRAGMVRVYGRGSQVPEDTMWRSYTVVNDLPEDEARAKVESVGFGWEPPRSGETKVVEEAWDVADTRWVSREERVNPPKPSGRGWEQYDTGDGVVWRRPRTRMRLVELESAPELTTNERVAVNRAGSDTLSVCLHEFSHRFEQVVPYIHRLEAEFLRRRTTDPDTGERSPLTRLYAGRDEWARADGFASAYMGKEYDQEHTEILSMGMESVFAGQSGGGVGLYGHSADEEYTAFIVGLLATVRAV